MPSPLLRRLLLLAAILLAIPFLLEPVLARLLIEEPGTRDLYVLEGEELDRLDWRVAAFFERTGEALAPDGFERAGTFVVPTAGPVVRIYGALFAAERQPALAVALAQATSDEGPLASRRLNFTTLLADGRAIETDNDPAPSLPLDGPDYVYFPVPGEEDASQLLRRHCAFVASASDGGEVAWLPLGEELAEMQREIDAQVDERIASGHWYVADAEQGTQRLTWTGAFALTWGEVWPLRVLDRWQRLEEALERTTAALEGVDLEQPCPPRARPDDPT